MSETPIYDQTFQDAVDHAIETGQEELLDDLQAMDKETTP